MFTAACFVGVAGLPNAAAMRGFDLSKSFLRRKPRSVSTALAAEKAVKTCRYRGYGLKTAFPMA